jgi:uncharacterized repeat protein (TIGR03803 family)
MVGRLLGALLLLGECGAAQNPPPRLTTLYSFPCCAPGGVPENGYAPITPLTIGEGGVLYGTTWFGGSATPPSAYGYGTVFSLTPPAIPGGAWTYAMLYEFHGTDGANPGTRLLIGSGGVLYGTTRAGGSRGSGAVFSLTPPAVPGDQWSEAVLHSFGGELPNGNPDGYEPSALTMSPAGVLFGTTSYGGTPAGVDQENGVVFVLLPPVSPSTHWTESVLYNFGHSCAAGCNPSSLVLSGSGVLYGAAGSGGSFTGGVVFAVAPPASEGGTWSYSIIYNFGEYLNSAVTPVFVAVGANGLLFGTTINGGASNAGTIFSLTPPTAPGGAWTEALLYNLPPPPYLPTGTPGPTTLPITLGENNTIFGTTPFDGGGGFGTAYVLQPPSTPGGAWTEELLHTFTGGTDGSYPSGLAIGADGVLYGATQTGGYGFGVIFSLAE